MKNAQILTWNVYEFNYSTRELKVFKRSLTVGNREKWIYKEWNELLKVIDSTLAGR